MNILRLSKSSILLVPTLCVGTYATDALRPWADDAERRNTCVSTRSMGTREMRNFKGTGRRPLLVDWLSCRGNTCFCTKYLNTKGMT